MGRPMLPRPRCIVCGSTCRTRGRFFCSRACRGLANRGVARPDAIGNQWASKGNAATKWAHYKRMQKLCKPGPCVVCGDVGDVIHHKDHNPLNTVPENLERQCRACHAKHHNRKAA